MENKALNEIPLTEVTFMILLSLFKSPKHGYAIMKDVEKLSGRRVQFSTGTLYGAIKRLLENGWICRFEEEEQTEGKRERKSYELTDLGRAVFQAEFARLKFLMEISTLRMADEVG